MYQIFELPHDFLDRDYTENEKAEFDQKIWDAIHGPELNEELTPKQKAKVDNWAKYGWKDPAVKREHNRVFGEGIERIVLPYDESTDAKLSTYNFRTWHSGRNAGKPENHATVLSHLEDAGYHTTDYASGLVYHKDKPERLMKVSKAMNLAGIADRQIPNHRVYKDDGSSTAMTLKQVYETDPFRAASKQQKQIVITRNKYDVAGMSTDRGWSSCMNMVDGCNKRYLSHDISQGTVTAYLTNKGDDNVTKPIGRINLKRFDSASHTIFRPEGASYGTTPKGFNKQVSEWADNNYPSKPGVYIKHASLYNDDGKSHRMEKLDQIPASDISDSAQTAAHRALRAYEDMPNKHDGWDDGPDYAKDAAFQAAHAIMKHLSPADHAKEIVHHIAAHSEEHDGDNQSTDDSHFAQAWHPSEIHGSDVMHQWGMHSMNSRQGSEKFKDGLTATDNESLHKMVDKVHRAMKGAEENDHPVLKEVYSGLVNEAFRRDVPHIHSEILHHMTDETNSEFHGDMMGNHMTIFDQHHPIQLTHDPRLMHHILNSDTSHFTHSDPFNFDVFHHIGKYGDTKVAHAAMHHIDINDDSRRGLVKGLNENPDGEKIQHHLINDMLLTGGEYHGGGMLRDIHSKSDLANALRGNHHGFPRIHGFNPEHTDDERDHVEKFADIANYTKFPSVYNRIKKRAEPGGDLDHESIRDGIKYNTGLKEHYEVDKNDKRRFKDFMSIIK